MGRLLDIELHRALTASGWSRIMVGWLDTIYYYFFCSNTFASSVSILATTASNATLCDSYFTVSESHRTVTTPPADPTPFDPSLLLPARHGDTRQRYSAAHWQGRVVRKVDTRPACCLVPSFDVYPAASRCLKTLLTQLLDVAAFSDIVLTETTAGCQHSPRYHSCHCQTDQL